MDGPTLRWTEKWLIQSRSTRLKKGIFTVEIFSVSLRSFGDKLVGMFFVVDQLAISASRAIASLAE